MSDDFLYADVLKTRASDNQSGIGVLVEPSVTMNSAHFSFQAIRELMKPPTAKPNESGYHTLVEKK